MRTLLRGGRVLGAAQQPSTALLVESDRIVWVGDDDEAADLSADRTVDLSGALVTPGFVDAHFHTTGTGLAITGLDLSAATSARDLLDRVTEHTRRVRGRPVLGSGWDETTWADPRLPTVAELDRAGVGGLVYLARTDAHSALASSALRASVRGLAGLAGYSPDGPLTVEAHHAVRQLALAAITPGQRTELQAAALRAAAALGVVAVHEMAGPEISGADDAAALMALAADGLPRVQLYWGELGGIGTATELGAVGAGGDLFCDGSVGSHTAGLHAPYADSDGSGYLRFDTVELAGHIAACTRAGLQAGFHAIGDAATDQVLAAMRLAADEVGPDAIRAAGHRLEHAEMLTDVRAVADLGLVLSVQPAFDAAWGGDEAMYARRLGTDRARAMNPFAALLAAGVPLAFGSDSPVTPTDPWGGVLAAVQHRTPAHRIGFDAALAAHTSGGWSAARASDPLAGRLVAGAPAHLAMFEPPAGDADPAGYRAAPTCLRTVFAGQVLFDSGALQ